MGRYRDDPAALAALFDGDRVHRDVYLDPEVFALEMERLWASSWVFAGHASQVPGLGDARALAIGPVSLRLERFAPPAADPRVPDPGVRVVREGGAGAVATAVRRDFVFCRLSAEGPGFEEALGDMLAVLDNVADRSPTGRLTMAGGGLRTLVRANWKIYLENINDTVHPPSTHESASAAARDLWAGQPPDAPKPMAMQQMLPFGVGYEAFEAMGSRALPHGHSVLGTRASLHVSYAGLDGYEEAMREAYGETRAREILAFTPQNAVIFPSLSVKGAPQAIRVLRPLGPERTVLEAWALQPQGAPVELLRRGVGYNRLVFSPMSVVAHDDLHVFETIHAALRARGNPWVSLHRGWQAGETDPPPAGLEAGGTSELLLRNHYRAWRRALAAPALPA